MISAAAPDPVTVYPNVPIAGCDRPIIIHIRRLCGYITGLTAHKSQTAACYSND